MLVDAANSSLLMVDVQEKVLPAMHEPQRVVDNCAWLLRLARSMAVPILASEQYPNGLGATVAPLRELLQPDEIMSKVHFSCVAEPGCRQRIDALARPQVVLAGIEAHVCVLQTVMHLLEIGKQVFLVADAVTSRVAREVELAIARMRQAGAAVVSREMVLFEWTGKAGTDRFRQLSQTFLA